MLAQIRHDLSTACLSKLKKRAQIDSTTATGPKLQWRNRGKVR